ncbi:MAG TPA: MFS transporter [Acidimicrobiia bacterium]|nr:MFS transporter [Acidimicrobiia bacterium]
MRWTDQRSRLTAVLFGGVALGSTAHIAAVTVSTLAVDEITGSSTLAGVPSASAVVGTALGTSLLTLSMARRGRRPGLIWGYIVAASGAIASLFAMATLSFPLLIAGMALLGVGNASNALARYTAADMHPPDRRGAALGIVVWASTVGSVLGPALLQPSGRVALDLGRSELAGGYLVSLTFLVLALLLYVVALRPDPASLAEAASGVPRVRGDLWAALRMPQVRVALTAMVTGQVVMVMIMTATPLHLRHHGSDLGIVGLVMSAHTLGMFALSPITGRLVDRYGGTGVALGGVGLLGLSALAAASAPNQSTALLLVTLFALGFGWNLAFVSGSSLLTGGMGSELRARLQGRVDSIAWGSGALASITSGVVYQATDYRVTSLIGLVLLVLPAVIIGRRRRLVTPAEV